MSNSWRLTALVVMLILAIGASVLLIAMTDG